MATQAERHGWSSGRDRAKDLVSRGRDRAERVARGIEASRDEVGAIDVALSTAERDRTGNGGILAGALAFRAFLWLLPAVLTVVLVLGTASTATSTDPKDVAKDAGLPAFA